VPRIKRRTNDLRERAVAAALAVLAEDGLAGLTTRNVAARAQASVPAVYEVFGDKAGLIREVFFEGFRMLGDELAAVPAADDPLEALDLLAEAFRAFVVAHPALARIMFGRPFVDFDPSTEENRAAARVRKIFLARVQTAVDAGLIVGDPTDIALVFFALLEGLTAAENARRLGSSRHSVERRRRLGVSTLLAGLRPTG
jgi:AcrR family transcriptional regulator